MTIALGIPLSGEGQVRPSQGRAVLAPPSSALAQLLTPAQREVVATLRARIGTAQAEPIDRSAQRFVSGILQELRARAGSGRTLDAARLPRALKLALREYVDEYVRGSGERDVERVVEGATAVALAALSDLGAVNASSVQRTRGVSAGIREQIAEVRTLEAEAGVVFPFVSTYPIVTRNAEGIVFATDTLRVESADLVEPALAALQRRLAAAEAAENMLLADQQAMTQQLSDMVDLISNIVRAAHDVAMNSIRNMRA